MTGIDVIIIWVSTFVLTVPVGIFYRIMWHFKK